MLLVQIIVLLHQLSYARKTQLQAPKALYQLRLLIIWLVLMTEDITSVGVITLDDTRGSLSEGWDLRIQLYDFPDCYCLVYSNFDWAHFECQ